LLDESILSAGTICTPARDGIHSVNSESGYDAPQPALDSRFDLNPVTGCFGFANISSLPSFPQCNTGTADTPTTSTNSSEGRDSDVNHGFASTAALQPLSSPVSPLNNNLALSAAEGNQNLASVLSPADSLQDRSSPDARKRRRIEPPTPQLHKCPHCPRPFADSHRLG
jgi:hypothetical protein